MLHECDSIYYYGVVLKLQNMGKGRIMKKNLGTVLKYTLLVFAVAFIVLAMRSGQVRAGEDKKISLNSTKLTLYAGDTYKLELNNVPANKKVTFKSGKKSVAKVGSNGMITAVKAGKATITAKYNGKKYKCAVTVKKRPAAAKTIYSDATFAEDDEYAYYLDTEALAAGGTAWGYMSGGYLCKVKKDGSEEPVVLMNDVCYKPMLAGNYVYYLYCWSTKYYDNKFYWCCRIKTDGTGAETLTGKEYSITDYTIYDNTMYCSVKRADYMVDGKWPDFPEGIYAMNLSDKKMTRISDAIAFNLHIYKGRLYYSANYKPADYKSLSEIGYYLFGINLDGTGKIVYDQMPTNSSDYRQQFAGAGSDIYYVNTGNFLCKIDTAGTKNPEKLMKVYGSLVVNGDRIYAASNYENDYGSVSSNGIIRIDTKTGVSEQLIDGEYYPDHIFGNRIYINTLKGFAGGKLAILGYDGSAWKIFKDEIDFATINKLKNIKDLPD